MTVSIAQQTVAVEWDATVHTANESKSQTGLKENQEELMTTTEEVIMPIKAVKWHVYLTLWWKLAQDRRMRMCSHSAAVLGEISMPVASEMDKGANFKT